MHPMVQNAMGVSLAALRRVAGAPFLDRVGLRATAEKALYQGARVGFGAAQEAVSRFAKQRGGAAVRGDRPGGGDLFDLRPTEEQELVVGSVRRLAAEVLRPAAAQADDALAPPAQVLAEAHELGLVMMAVPESLGGVADERSAVTQALVAQELSRGDMALAYAILSPLAVVNALVDHGTGDQQARYLPPFLGETFVPAALAVLEHRALFDPWQLRTRAVRKPDGYHLTGDKALVALGRTGELFLVAAELVGVGPRLFLVEPGTPGLSVEDQPAMGLRGAGTARLVLEDVRVDHDALLGGEGDFDYGAVLDRARIGWAAMAVGTCEAMLEYTKEYCSDRVAFGEPITNRQAVAFLLADIAIETEGMRLLTLRAASRAEHGLPFGREAALARAQAARYGMKVGTDGVQLLGGAGFIKDHPVERWYRHLRAVGVMEGGVGA